MKEGKRRIFGREGEMMRGKKRKENGRGILEREGEEKGRKEEWKRKERKNRRREEYSI